MIVVEHPTISAAPTKHARSAARMAEGYLWLGQGPVPLTTPESGNVIRVGSQAGP